MAQQSDVSTTLSKSVVQRVAKSRIAKGLRFGRIQWLGKSPYPVRKPNLTIEPESKYWADNDPFLTHHLAVLSALFPDGEQFFVDSLSAYLPDIDDPSVKAEIRSFIGQEAQHSVQHARLNKDAGVDVRWVERHLQLVLKPVRRFMGREQHLAITACAEHFTACMAAALLERSDVLERINDPQLLKLWAWHATEENEHKATTMDVYRSVGGSEALRIGLMPAVSVILLGYLIALPQVVQMARDGQLLNVKSWLHGIKVTLGRGGFYTALVADYLQWYRPGFHPNDIDTEAMLAAWQQRLGMNDDESTATVH